MSAVQVCCLPKALEASESHIAPQRGLAEMLSLPDTDNMQGTQTMDGMWTLVLRGGMFVISAKLCWQVQFAAGACHVEFLVTKCAVLS